MKMMFYGFTFNFSCVIASHWTALFRDGRRWINRILISNNNPRLISNEYRVNGDGMKI